MVLTCSSSLKTIQLLAWGSNLSAPTGSETCLTEVWSSVSVQGHLCSGNISVTLDQTCENRYVLRNSCARNTCKKQCWGGEGAVGVPLLLGSGGAFQLASLHHHFTGNLTAVTSVPPRSGYYSPQTSLQTCRHFLPHYTCWIWQH